MKLRTRLALVVLVTALPVVAGITWMRADLERRTVETGLREFVLARMVDYGGREQCENSPETFPEPPRGRPFGPGGDRDDRRMPGERRPPFDDGEPPGERRPPGDRRGPPDDGGPGRGQRQFGPRPMAAAGMPRIDVWAYDTNFTSANPRAPALPAALRAELERGREFASTRWTGGEHHDGTEFAMRMPWNEGPCAIVLARRPGDGTRGAVSDLLWSSLALSGVLLATVLFAAGPIVERVRRLTAQVKHSAATRYATPIEETGHDEVTELARAFNTAGNEVKLNLETVEKRERTLRAFVENTTHDVMLPLTVLQGHLTTLRRRIEAGTLPDKEIVRDALEESHYLTSLLQNLGIAARLEGAELPLARHAVDLNALVERAVARQRPIAVQKGVAVEYGVPEETLRVEGDVTLLEQMLSNVIHNAVRYGKDGGHVAVLLEPRGADGSEFALRVLDDGPGIPDEMRGRVVERAFRTDDARSRHPEGLGLGLSIAKDVAERHGLSMDMRRSSAGGLEIEFAGKRLGGGSLPALGAGDRTS